MTHDILKSLVEMARRGIVRRLAKFGIFAAAILPVCGLFIFAQTTRTPPPASSFSDERVNIEPRVKPPATQPENQAGGNGRNGPTIRTESTLVLINVTVTDPSNRFVTGLEKEHFKLFEDKMEQNILQFSSEDAPLSIGIVFDTSGSMGPKLQKSRQAVVQFFKTANAEDEFFLIEFSD